MSIHERVSNVNACVAMETSIMYTVCNITCINADRFTCVRTCARDKMYAHVVRIVHESIKYETNAKCKLSQIFCNS